MHARDQLENTLSLPSSDLTLTAVNKYLMAKYAPTPSNASQADLRNKLTKDLGQVFYQVYSWVDPSYRVLTDKDIRDLLMEQQAMFMYSNLAPWPCTMFPRNPADVKYLSVFRNGTEYVCRTRADRQRGIEYYSNSSEIFQCKICCDVISTPFHCYVNCFIFKESPPFHMILKYRKTFYRACYLHFKLEGVKLSGRNIYKDAEVNHGEYQTQIGGRGRGRGRGTWRRGTPKPRLFD